MLDKAKAAGTTVTEGTLNNDSFSDEKKHRDTKQVNVQRRSDERFESQSKLKCRDFRELMLICRD